MNTGQQTPPAVVLSTTKLSGTERPLKAGTVIDFCGELATVIADNGGKKISVYADGFKQDWYWSFEGARCTVVSLPDNVMYPANPAG